MKGINLTLPSFLRRRSGKNRAPGRRPARDWFIMLILAAFIAGGIWLFGGYLFLNVHTEKGALTEEEGAPSGSLDRKKLDDTVAFYAARIKKLEELKRTHPSFVDPAR